MPTIQLTEGLVVVVRRGFEPAVDSAGNAQHDKDGQAVYAAEAVIPGKLPSRFADVDGPDLVRLRCAGHNPGSGAGDVVRLSGKVLITAWYNRQRGSEARSDITVSAERVENARGATPAITGGLPAVLPPGMYLGSTDNVASVMLPPEGVHHVDGLVAVKVAAPVPVDLVGQDVVPVGLRCYFTAPAREDVSQRSKAELVLVAQSLERVAVSNGRGRRTDPVPAAVVDAPSEG
ncbi:MAG: hypothetical protein AB7H92_14105 [Microbacteriaceae bacterium]